MSGCVGVLPPVSERAASVGAESRSRKPLNQPAPPGGCQIIARGGQTRLDWRLERTEPRPLVQTIISVATETSRLTDVPLIHAAQNHTSCPKCPQSFVCLHSSASATADQSKEVMCDFLVFFSVFESFTFNRKKKLTTGAKVHSGGRKKSLECKSLFSATLICPGTAVWLTGSPNSLVFMCLTVHAVSEHQTKHFSYLKSYLKSNTSLTPYSLLFKAKFLQKIVSN